MSISVTSVTAKRPGGELATRPLHFIWIVDCSGSMEGEKIRQVNYAIQESLPEMVAVAEDNPNAQVFVRAIKFSSGAQWHIAEPTPVEEFEWINLEADGVTDMGKAMSMVAEQLKIPPMSDRALPPVLVLLSDGQPTDDYTRGLRELMAIPWGKKAVRIAIAIGPDADIDELQKFIGNSEFKVLQAHNAPTLVKYIKWASTVVLKAASSPASQIDNGNPTSLNVPIPVAVPSSADDIW